MTLASLTQRWPDTAWFHPWGCRARRSSVWTVTRVWAQTKLTHLSYLAASRASRESRLCPAAWGLDPCPGTSPALLGSWVGALQAGG